MRNILLLAIGLAFFPAWALGHGGGQSAYPMPDRGKLVGVELTGDFSDGGGVGVQARYTQKISRPLIFDAGFGTSGGERSGALVWRT